MTPSGLVGSVTTKASSVGKSVIAAALLCPARSTGVDTEKELDLPIVLPLFFTISVLLATLSWRCAAPARPKTRDQSTQTRDIQSDIQTSDIQTSSIRYYEVPPEIVVTSEYGAKYHRPDCGAVNRLNTRGKRFFTPCKLCFR